MRLSFPAPARIVSSLARLLILIIAASVSQTSAGGAPTTQPATQPTAPPPIDARAAALEAAARAAGEPYDPSNIDWYHPEDPAWVPYQEAREHMRARRHAQAAAKFSEAIQANPDWWRAYVNRAPEYRALGRHEEAIADCTKAIAFQPRYWVPYLNRASALVDLKRFDEAIRDLTIAIELNPWDASIYLARGAAHVLRGEKDRAAADCLQALEVNPKEFRAHTMLAVLGGPAKAREHLENAIAAAPEAHDLRVLRAALRLNEGKHREALEDYEAVLKADPDHAAALAGRARALAAMGEGSTAMEELTKAGRAAQSQQEQAHVRLQRAKVNEQMGRLDLAAKDTDLLLAKDRDYYDALFYRAYLHQEMGEPRKAIPLYDRCIGVQPLEDAAFGNRANAYSALGEYDKALADYGRAIEIAPDTARYWGNRGRCHVRRGAFQDALADFAEALELDPKDAQTWEDRAGTYMRMGDYRKTLETYHKVIALAPREPRHYYWRGWTHEKLGDMAAAKADAQKAVELKPDYPEAQNLLARVSTGIPSKHAPAAGR